jgi:hypothetical protein
MRTYPSVLFKQDEKPQSSTEEKPAPEADAPGAGASSGMDEGLD